MIAANGAGAVFGAPIISRVMDKANPKLKVAISLLAEATKYALVMINIAVAAK